LYESVQLGPFDLGFADQLIRQGSVGITNERPPRRVGPRMARGLDGLNGKRFPRHHRERFGSR
jgi:hypothetical protein